MEDCKAVTPLGQENQGFDQGVRFDEVERARSEWEDRSMSEERCKLGEKAMVFAGEEA